MSYVTPRHNYSSSTATWWSHHPHLAFRRCALITPLFLSYFDVTVFIIDHCWQIRWNLVTPPNVLTLCQYLYLLFVIMTGVLFFGNDDTCFVLSRFISKFQFNACLICCLVNMALWCLQHGAMSLQFDAVPYQSIAIKSHHLQTNSIT